MHRDCPTDRPINADTFRAHIASRIHLTDPLRMRLVEFPFGLDRPYWVEDPDLDLEYHVRGMALPAPGSRYQLAEQVERIVSRPLDRAHPLWELYVIKGLANGVVAVLTKLHHAAVDGQAGVKIMTTLLDSTPEGREIPPPSTSEPPPPVPSELEMLASPGSTCFDDRRPCSSSATTSRSKVSECRNSSAH